ncbi:hypothetical protein JHW43_007122 [Diplocarpon mali]|nr:hypothetical protein JHW43_007122 [Diplocarpon mali]
MPESRLQDSKLGIFHITQLYHIYGILIPDQNQLFGVHWNCPEDTPDAPANDLLSFQTRYLRYFVGLRRLKIGDPGLSLTAILVSREGQGDGASMVYIDDTRAMDSPQTCINDGPRG